MLKKTLILICSIFSFSVASHAERILLIYDGNLIEKTNSMSFYGNDCIPLKAAAALFNGRSQWYPIAGTVVLQVANRRIAFTSGSREISIGDRKEYLSSPARLVNGSLFVPIRFFLSQAFCDMVNCQVNWDRNKSILTADPVESLFPPRVYSQSGWTRIVLESTKVMVPDFNLKGRLITVNIPNERIVSGETIKVKDHVIDSVKMVQNHRNVTLKIYLADGTTSYSHSLEKDFHRLSLLIREPNVPAPDEDEVSISTLIFTPVPAVSTRMENADLSPRKNNSSSARVRRIVVDAGHGGHDPGAIGRMGTKEKDINLLLATELARVLREEGGYDVILSRSSDSFIALADRTTFANDHQADLFVSVHCNAAPRRRSQHGFEIYFLSEKASDPHAEEIAEFENTEIDSDGAGSSRNFKLQALLFSMARNQFINQSSLLCNSIARAVDKRKLIEDRGVMQANFHVLHGAQMPSVLVETAYITNLSEEKKLRQRKFRSAIVDAIFSGIEDFKKETVLLNGVKSIKNQ